MTPAPATRELQPGEASYIRERPGYPVRNKLLRKGPAPEAECDSRRDQDGARVAPPSF